MSDRTVGRDCSLVSGTLKLSGIESRPAASVLILFMGIFFLLINIAFIGSASAESQTASESLLSVDEKSSDKKWQWQFNPNSDLYKRYIANPLRTNTSIIRANFSDSEIPDTGEARYIIRMGGRWGFFRWHPSSNPDSGFQFDLEGSFLGIFDIDNSQDNIGWSGIYGFIFSWSNGDWISAKLCFKHDSSHVGDEYAENTGRKRINYTRQEYLFGLSLSGTDWARIYGEAGYGYDLRNEAIQDKWRVSSGLELDHAKLFHNPITGGRFGCYAAADFTWYEEDNWKTDITLQAGLVAKSDLLFRTYRLGFEYRDGRSLIGELSQHQEKYFGFGLSGDL